MWPAGLGPRGAKVAGPNPRSPVWGGPVGLTGRSRHAVQVEVGVPWTPCLAARPVKETAAVTPGDACVVLVTFSDSLV